MTLDLISELIKNYGLPIGLVAFFIYRDWKREILMTTRIQNLENEIRRILLDQLTKSTRALLDSSSAIREIIKVVKAIPCLPCVAKELLNKEEK